MSLHRVKHCARCLCLKKHLRGISGWQSRRDKRQPHLSSVVCSDEHRYKALLYLSFSFSLYLLCFTTPTPALLSLPTIAWTKQQADGNTLIWTVSECGNAEEQEGDSEGSYVKRMKRWMLAGPDDIPVEVWRALGERALMESERMPDDWRTSLGESMSKNKDDV